MFAAHHILNFGCYKNLFRGKYTAFRIFQVGIDVLTLLSIAVLVYSSVILSRYVFAFLLVESGLAVAFCMVDDFFLASCAGKEEKHGSMDLEQTQPEAVESGRLNQAADEKTENTRPALVSHVENMDQYDTVFLGFPNWWYTVRKWTIQSLLLIRG